MVGCLDRRIVVIAVALTALVATATSAATEYTIDPDRTSIEFQLRSLGSLQRGHLTGAAGTVALERLPRRARST